MTTIDFYIFEENQIKSFLDKICKLIYKIYKEKNTIYIHTDTEQKAFQLDKSLWTFDEESFLPHGINGQLIGSVPILIGFGSAPTDCFDVLLNFSDEIPSFYQKFHRILELVSPNEKSKALARERYRFYRAQAFKINTHQ